MLGCPSPKKSYKSSDNAHHIVGDLGEVSCVVRKGAESFQARVEEPLGSDSYQTISKRSGECWLQIGLKKCFVLLCPIGEQQRLFWDGFVFSNSTAIVSPYLSGALTKVVHARETVIFFFPNQKRRNYRWFEKTFRIYGFNTTNLRSEFRHFLLRMFQCYFLWEKKIFSGKMLTKTLEYC